MIKISSIIDISWEFSKILQSIFFLSIFICLEELSYMKYYMKVRSAARNEEKPLFIFPQSGSKYETSAKKNLKNRTVHLV